MLNWRRFDIYYDLITFAKYNLVLKRLSVRGSHSVAHNKTHAENVASEESQRL